MPYLASIGGQNVKIMGKADLSRLIVRGRGAHIATALTTLGWSKGPAVTTLAKFENGQVEGARYEAIGSPKGVEIPLRNLDRETKDGVAVIDMRMRLNQLMIPRNLQKCVELMMKVILW